MLTLVSTLVTVIVAFGTTEPLASLTSPVIVAVSCCANAEAEQSISSIQRNEKTKCHFLILIPPLHREWYELLQFLIATFPAKQACLIMVWILRGTLSLHFR